MPSVRQKASNACQRCRRQKLRCDSSKPCTLCLRASVQCIAAEDARQKSVNGVSKRKALRTGRSRAKATSAMRQLPDESSTVNDEQNDFHSQSPPAPNENHAEVPKTMPGAPTASSSTMAMIEEAFRSHGTTGPNELNTTAYRTNPGNRIGRSNHFRSQPQSMNGLPRSKTTIPTGFLAPRKRYGAASPELSQSAIQDFVAILPAREVTLLLIDTYFDKIHWFMLLFHQNGFRERSLSLVENVATGSTNLDLGLLSTVVAVCAVSIQFLEVSGRADFIQSTPNIDELEHAMIQLLGRRLLEILAVGSLESVQTCVLLGTYYLYHGEPDLAMPICGCGLRVAQRLNLHRQSTRSVARSVDQLDLQYRETEARKRCWWAIFEIETFCSTLYGLPPSISHNDCDVDYLTVTGEESHIGGRDHGGRNLGFSPLLLAYKPAMSKLSVLLRMVLDDLYCVHSGPSNQSSSTGAQSGHLHVLISKVQTLSNRLLQWERQLPPVLHFARLRGPVHNEHHICPFSDDTTLANPGFNCRISMYQIVILKLTFENTRILIQRPLLAYGTRPRIYPLTTACRTRDSTGRGEDPCKFAMQSCRDAALAVSNISSAPIFKEACNTYAVATIGTTLFNAGIILCIMASLEPLSSSCHEYKLGLRRLMHMQDAIKSKSVLADQGLAILQNLTALVLQTELVSLLDHSTEQQETESLSYSLGPVPNFSPSGLHDFSNLAVVLDPAAESQMELTGTHSVHEGNVEDDFYEHTTTIQTISELNDAIRVQFNNASNTHVSASNANEPDFYQVDAEDWTDQDQGWIWNVDFLKINS